MLVSKKRLYTELCKITDVITRVIDVVYDNHDKCEADIIDVKQRINYTLEKLLELTDRVEALESKRHHKPAKKSTKKNKGK